MVVVNILWVNCGIIFWILLCGLIIVVMLLLVLCSSGWVSFRVCICVIWKCCYGLMDLLNQVLLEMVSRKLVFGWKLFCICLLRIILQQMVVVSFRLCVISCGCMQGLWLKEDIGRLKNGVSGCRIDFSGINLLNGIRWFLLQWLVELQWYGLFLLRVMMVLQVL